MQRTSMANTDFQNNSHPEWFFVSERAHQYQAEAIWQQCHQLYPFAKKLPTRKEVTLQHQLGKARARSEIYAVSSTEFLVYHVFRSNA
jgi:hypothetical protein